MSFISKHIVDNDERIRCVARLHWVYVVQGVIWFFLFLTIAEAIRTGLSYAIGAPCCDQLAPVMVMGYNIGSPFQWIVWMMVGTGLMVFLVYLFKYMSSEIALTSHRIIYKTGLLFIEVEEVDLSEIRAETVDHGLFGRFFNYGRLKLDSRFVGDIVLPAMRAPYKFLQMMHRMRRQERERAVVAA